MYESGSKEELELLKPVMFTGKKVFILMISLAAIVAFGGIAFVYQLINGLGVTGLSNRVFWGIYVSNFIFFIGISYSGTLISAILRLTNAGWRTPLTRMAEVITVIGIFVGFSMIMIDMGRIDRVLILPFALKVQSPLFWDFMAVTTYLLGSVIFLLLPMIPDMAILREKFKDRPKYDIRKYLYKFLAFGWNNSEKQQKILHKSINILSVILIPVAVTCHTVIAFIFAMTWRVGWHSTIFGPFFVVAAIFSGTAAIIVVMAIVRRVYHYEDILTHRHFRNLGLILLTLLFAYFYFTATEYFTSGYRAEMEDMELLVEILFGAYAIDFWFFIFFGVAIPGTIFIYYCWKYESERAIWMMTAASIMVIAAMWVKRYIIVIPALARPFVAEEWTIYNPTWVEWAITFAGVAGFILAYLIFIKLFPIISIWEMKEHNEIEQKD
jgi:molybdopterin-containing oxidoreductase family membrane subunit